MTLSLPTGRAAAVTYMDQTCYCVKGQDSTIRSAIANFTEPPEVSKFEYIGAKYNATSDHFDPCVCTDGELVLLHLLYVGYIRVFWKPNSEFFNELIFLLISVSFSVLYSVG